MSTATARRDLYRRIADRARRLPGEHGLRVNRVYAVTGAWDGTYTGEGSETQTSTELLVGGSQPPKVRQVDDETIAIGSLKDGTIEVGPITPQHSAGGIAVASLLATSVTTGATWHLQVVGPEGTKYYRVVSVTTDRALRYMIRAEPVGGE